MKKRIRGGKYWRWGALVFILLGVIVCVRSFQVSKKVGLRDSVIERHDLRIEELKRKASSLSKLMAEAESTKDKVRYLELVKKAALNQIELDQEWKSLHESLRSRQLGKQASRKAGLPVPGGLMNTFTEQEKLEMLAKAYALDPKSLEFLKAEIGIMFSNEFRGNVLEEIHDTLASEASEDF